MDGLLDQILTSHDPSSPIEKAAFQGSIIRQLSPHIYSSLFSSHVDGHPADWYARTVNAALALLEKGNRGPTVDGWLLEIAFHANLALCDTDEYYRNFVLIEQALRRFEQQHVNRSSQYVHGLLAYARDDLERAEHAFTAPAFADTPLLSHHAGYAAFRAPSFRHTLLDYDPPIELNFAQGKDGSDNTSIVLLCSCDELYFAAFANEFASQVFDVSNNTHIHFHLINTVNPPCLIDNDLFADSRVSVSIEHTDVAQPGKYAIMARYIVLPRLMRLWSKPVIVTDIDMLIKSDPASLHFEQSALLAFRHNSLSLHVPAAAIIGHQNLFGFDEAGLEFATLLSRYLHYMCARGRALWAADQVALLIVWRMQRNVASIGSIREHSYYRYGSSPERRLRKKEAEKRLNALKRAV